MSSQDSKGIFRLTWQPYTVPCFVGPRWQNGLSDKRGERHPEIHPHGAHWHAPERTPLDREANQLFLFSSFVRCETFRFKSEKVPWNYNKLIALQSMVSDGSSWIPGVHSLLLSLSQVWDVKDKIMSFCGTFLRGGPEGTHPAGHTHLRRQCDILCNSGPKSLHGTHCGSLVNIC